MGKFRIVTQGIEDRELAWTNLEEAKYIFKEYVGRGYLALVEDKQTGKTKVIENFDPTAEEITLLKLYA